MIESTLEPLFHITSLPKHWIIADVNSNFVISNANLEIESFSLYESICDADRLDFGRCNSARVTFTCLNIDLNLINKTFDISFTFEGHPNEPFNVGRFTVIEDKPSSDRKSREVVLQDALYFILNTNYASWYNALNWTGLTLGGFIDSFLTHVGLTADTASRAELVNASMPVEKTLVTNELLGSTILYAVCQIAGCFGVINREGKFKFLYLKSDIEGLYPANDLYPAEDLYPIEPAGTLINDNEYYPPLIYETYMTPQITKLHITENTEDVGTIVGSGDSQYNIMGNFLLMGKDASDITTYCTNTLGAMTKRNYRPYSVSKMGNLCFEIGDPIRMSNDRMAVESYMLTRTFTGTQGFIDNISAEGTQDYTTTANTASASVQQLNSKTLKLKQDINGVSTELTYQLDPTQGTPGGTHNSYAYQTAEEIGKRVTYTVFNYELDPTQAGGGGQHESYAHQTADKIDARVTYTDFNYELDPTQGTPGGTHNSYAYQTAEQIGAKVETTTYNNFVNNTYATFVTQTDQSLTAKAEKRVGDFTTGFSCTLDTTGHTWYKDNQQVMKIDGSGLTVTGTITGSAFLCGNSSNYTTEIRADGSYAKFAGGATYFQHAEDGSNTAYLANGVISATSFSSGEAYVNISGVVGGAIEYFYIGSTKHAMMQSTVAGAHVFEYYEDSSNSPVVRQLAIGSNITGVFQIDKVSLNGSTWVHVGINSPDVRIGGTNGTTTDVRIQADTNAHIKFRYTINAGTPQETVTTTTLADLMNDISSALGSASDAYTLASGIINNMLPGIVSTLNNHEQRITALENA